MSDMTITEVAVKYADAANTAARAEVRLTEHPEWAGYVARVVKGNRAALAREILGLDYAPKKGVRAEAVDFRRVETLATLLGRHAKNDGPKPVVLRATLSGEGGGSVTIPTDHALYATLVQMIQGDKAEAAA